MKKSELKNIIKECVKEVIFEEGTITSIVSEVVRGIAPTLHEGHVPNPRAAADPPSRDRKSVLDAIGKNSYGDIRKKFSNPEAFEGTTPLVESQKGAALAGVDPQDPGVDISKLPGAGSWGQVIARKGTR